MTVPLLCLTCLFLLFWVITLKNELAAYRKAEDQTRKGKGEAGSSGVKGTRSFKIG